MILEFGKYMGALVTPPGIIIVVALFGLLLQIRWRWIGYAITAVAIFALLPLSSPIAGHHLISSLEKQNPALSPKLTGKELHDRAEAIVVLGGGRYDAPPESLGDIVSNMTLERLRYGAVLQRASKLPLLVTGGSVFGEPAAEAELMAKTLKDDFGVEARWVEKKSRNTFENAEYTSAILNNAGIRRILLVTHAYHMPRSRWVFEQYGFEVVPAPTGFNTLGKFERGPFGYLPTAYGLRQSNRALSERIGLYWYKWRYKPSTSSKKNTEPKK